MKHMNVRAMILLVLCFAMIALTTSCGLFGEKTPDETSASIEEESDKAPAETSTTTKPKEETRVPNVEYKDAMSDDDFIHGSWDDSSEN